MAKKALKTPEPGARSLALDILAEAARRRQSVEDFLHATHRRHPGLNRGERALLLELVQGVKRWEIRLDYLLSRVSDLPLAKLHPVVLQILRLGAFQILMLDKIPARAAVNESANLARRKGLPRAHVGFINAVLRRLAAGPPPDLPAAPEDPVTALSITHAHPAWLVRRWLARYGPADTAVRLAANNQVPPTIIRINTLKTDRPGLIRRLAAEGVEASPCRFSPVGLVLTAIKTNPLEINSFKEGLWLFQDEAAQLVTLLLAVEAGTAIAEIGSGRGGKTTHLGELMDGQGLIGALDYHRGRLQELKRTVRRWGLELVQPLLADAASALPVKPNSLAAVVLDAPCSALGIIRRHPEIKTRLTEADLITFPPRQKAMLEHAAELLRPGGRLLYITCTTEPEENEAVVEAFLSRHPGYALATDNSLLPSPARSLVGPSGWFRSSPAEDGLDGFAAAVLMKS